MNNRLKSAIATALIQGVAVYALVVGLAMTISREPERKLTSVEIKPGAAPLPPPIPPSPVAPPMRLSPVPAGHRPVILGDWSKASPEQRNEDFRKAHQWVQDNMPEEEKRLAGWRETVPQGSGPGRVTRLRPPGLATHTLYWPAKWSKGPLPIIAWGNDHDGKCSNSSLPYAAFLSEIASHGYFVVAVGNDDIDYPQPEGLEILADGRPLRVPASALRQAIDWAIAENGRAGGPYAGRLDPGKVAYMGHGCGGGQAMSASSDTRATTIVALNSAGRFRPDPAAAHKAAIAHFEGARDADAVRDAGRDNFAKAQAAEWPMFKAALAGTGHDGPYSGPDRRWTRAVLAWLDWRLKGEDGAAATMSDLSRNGWSQVEATGLAAPQAPPSGHPTAVGVRTDIERRYLTADSSTR